MSNKKPFAELTKQGQKARLTKYAKEVEARGTVRVLARLVKDPNIVDIKGEAKSAFFRFATFNKETQKTEYFNASRYIQKDKVGQPFETFLSNLKKGQLVDVEYKVNGKYNDIYDLIDRSAADAKRKAENKAKREAAKAEAKA